MSEPGDKPHSSTRRLNMIVISLRGLYSAHVCSVRGLRLTWPIHSTGTIHQPPAPLPEPSYGQSNHHSWLALHPHFCKLATDNGGSGLENTNIGISEIQPVEFVIQHSVCVDLVETRAFYLLLHLQRDHPGGTTRKTFLLTPLDNQFFSMGEGQGIQLQQDFSW